MTAEHGETFPSDAAKFEYLLRRSPMVAVQLSKRDRHTEFKQACYIPKNSIIVFYYQQSSHQDIFSTVQQVRYRILGNHQPMGTGQCVVLIQTHTHTRHCLARYPGIQAYMWNLEISQHYRQIFLS